MVDFRESRVFARFLPVIPNIAPVTNLPLFLTENARIPDEQLTKVN